MNINVKGYRKFLAALLVAIVAGIKVLSDAIGDGTVSTQEIIAVVLAFLGALGVYAVPNEPPVVLEPPQVPPADGGV